MRKRPFGIMLITVLGLCCGAYNIVNNFEPIYFAIGIIVIILSAGLLSLSSNARAAVIFFSAIFVSLYFYLCYIWLRNSCHYFWGIGLIVHFPIFLWSVTSLVILNQKHIKLQFRK